MQRSIAEPPSNGSGAEYKLVYGSPDAENRESAVAESSNIGASNGNGGGISTATLHQWREEQSLRVRGWPGSVATCRRNGSRSGVEVVICTNTIND